MKDQKNIAFDPFNVDMMDPSGDFSKNDIDLWYYKDPGFKNISSQFAYANEDKPIMIPTNFFWGEGNNFERRSPATQDCTECTYTNLDPESRNTSSLEVA